MMAAIYFCSFIILSSMMILNLFIGVITTSMQEAKTALTEEMEAEEDLSPDDAMLKRLQRMSDDIDAMADEMQGWVPTQPVQTGTAGLLTVHLGPRFATLEKNRTLNAVVKLSRRDVFENMEHVAVPMSPTTGGPGTPSGRQRVNDNLKPRVPALPTVDVQDDGAGSTPPNGAGVGTCTPVQEVPGSTPRSPPQLEREGHD